MKQVDKIYSAVDAEEYATNVFNPVQEKFCITRELVQEHIAEGFKEGAQFGYSKANEWHYIKDGDLPKESEGKCFYLLWFGGEDYRIAEYVQGRFSVRWFYVEGVIAWKEIVPPAAKEVEK